MKRENTSKEMGFSYDAINDLLYVYKKDTKVDYNEAIGDIHIEFTKSGKAIGVEILNASDILKEFDIPQKMLDHLTGAELKVVKNGAAFLVLLTLHSENNEKSAMIALSPTAQAIHAV